MFRVLIGLAILFAALWRSPLGGLEHEPIPDPVERARKAAAKAAAALRAENAALKALAESESESD